VTAPREIDQNTTVMPAEWEIHRRTWMAFPVTAYGARDAGSARRAWSEVARTIAEHEPVSMLVRPEDHSAARELLADSVEIVPAELDDAWARDIGPTFVRDASGAKVAIDWRFNGWGAQGWARWQNDDRAAQVIAEAAGVRAVRSEFVNEGGGIEVDGAGRLVVTETVQRDPHRNPGRSREELEAEFRTRLGVTSITWLTRGLHGDYLEFGTRGHVDLLVKFVAPGVAVYHRQSNPAHPDAAVSEEIAAALADAGIEAVPLVAPSRLDVDGRLCDWSYVNCYLANGVVVLGTYDDPADDAAASTLSDLLPGRKVVRVDARPLFALGGGVHCITQQEPE